MARQCYLTIVPTKKSETHDCIVNQIIEMDPRDMGEAHKYLTCSSIEETIDVDVIPGNLGKNNKGWQGIGQPLTPRNY